MRLEEVSFLVTASNKPTIKRAAAIPLTPKATVPLFYKYSSLATPEHVERLRIIIQEHELYLPDLDQLNDPADGRPRLAPLSEEEMSHFLYQKLVQRSPHLSRATLEKEKTIIYYNVQRHGTKGLHRKLSEILHAELKHYRIYSMSKRFDNLNLWAKYAGDHSGYCLEFVNEGPLFEKARDVLYEDSLQMDVNNPDHTNGFWFFCKRPEWSDEEEVRLVLPRGMGSKVKLEPRWLKRLILGKSVSERNEQIIRAWARQRVPDLPVVKARYDIVDQKVMLGP
ncbi:MAG: DUF2971 domain-containing protein [Candidatus Sulfotelmatobacter sp.]